MREHGGDLAVSHEGSLTESANCNGGREHMSDERESCWELLEAARRQLCSDGGVSSRRHAWKMSLGRCRGDGLK